MVELRWVWRAATEYFGEKVLQYRQQVPRIIPGPIEYSRGPMEWTDWQDVPESED